MPYRATTEKEMTKGEEPQRGVEAEMPKSSERWIKGSKVRSVKTTHIYSGIDVQTLKKVDYIEMPIQKDSAERLEQNRCIIDKEYLPTVLYFWVEKGILTIISKPRGRQLLPMLLSGRDQRIFPGSILCNISRKILETAAQLERDQTKNKVTMDSITISEKGEIYIHNDGIWKDIVEACPSETQNEEERLRELGMALLSLGTGEMLEGVSMFSDIDIDNEEMQCKVLEQVIRISIPCFKEVVLSLLGNKYTPQLLEETLALHFFYPEEEQEIEPCRCEAEDYLNGGDMEEMYYNEKEFGQSQKKTEEIYDSAAGVSVKASTLDKTKFAFQMHFFKSSKKVSFFFNKNADTVASVVKEMEDEGLAEESEIELIKAHMENLMIKIGESTADETNEEKEPETSGPAATPVSLTAGEESDALKKEKDGSEAGPASTTTQVEGSEDSSDYSMKEFKDAQPISEFVSEVALVAKRAKSIADGWAGLLRKQDIKTVGDLRMLTEEDWEMLKLPVFASRAMKNILYGEAYTLFREKMLGIDERLKEYMNESTVEDLLSETAQNHGRPEMFNVWLQKVKCQDIRTVGELKLLTEEDWEQLDLSVFSYRAIRNAIFRHCKC
ncbi:WNK protein kinase [Nematocida ausubeli]|uniref:WNK protein kinase n=1 Tax=Nematocida ausubeli (strain ATCC PRA-371 / ERTm2) TaxID=1913371 RepID=H8ZDM7_NEMA1|nr:WNK protein kinase [Nematocida ausubeli]